GFHAGGRACLLVFLALLEKPLLHHLYDLGEKHLGCRDDAVISFDVADQFLSDFGFKAHGISSFQEYGCCLWYGRQYTVRQGWREAQECDGKELRRNGRRLSIGSLRCGSRDPT